MDKQRAPRAAFSLLELIAVISIIGFLATLIVPRVTDSAAKAREKSCFNNRAQINEAVEMYAVRNGVLPTTIADINTPDVFPDGIPTCPVSGAAYKLNTATSRVLGHTGGGKGGDHNP